MKPTAAAVPDYLAELAASLPLTMTLQQAAEAMCMHPRSVQRMIAAGELRATRAKLAGSARVILTRSEVVRWFSAHAAR